MVQYSDQRLFFTEFLSDLSLRGMCIVASKPLEPGTKLIISISTQAPIKVDGKVTWSKKSIKNKFKYEIGIQFDGLSQDQKSQIADIISSICWETNPMH
jgi:hypothetical protein